MAFLTRAAMEAAFGSDELRQLTDRARVGSIDDAVLNAAIDRAENEVSAIVRRRYPEFPTPVVPAAIIRTAADVARYYLFDKSIPELVRQRYEDALRFLRDAVFSAVDLGLTGEAPINADVAAPSRAITFGSNRRTEYDLPLNSDFYGGV